MDSKKNKSVKKTEKQSPKVKSDFEKLMEKLAPPIDGNMLRANHIKKPLND